jgi:putative transposase
MSELCQEFGIPRKTGYKIFDRYQECGVQRLTDRSRRPHHCAHKLPFQVENYILNLKREHPSWGARKIRERLTRRFSDIKIPAKSTVHALLDRHGFVERRSRARRRARGTLLSAGLRPNELWCTDYKGEFLLANRQYCYPLTATDPLLIPVPDSYWFGLSQSLLGATTFVKPLRSPHAFLMHGGLSCMLRI